MKVRELLAHLEKNYTPNDDIVVMWFDEQYCIDGLQSTAPAREILEQAWKEIADEAQETLEAHIDFTQTGYDIATLFEEKVTELLQKEEN